MKITLAIIMERRILLTVLTVFCIASVSIAEVLNVPGDYETIESALEEAAEEDTILIGNGEYTGQGNVNLDVEEPVVIMSENGPEECVVNCEDADNTRAFKVDCGAQIIGLTITGGTRGAILVDEADEFRISNCVICNNIMDDEGISGGGITIQESTGLIELCIFSENGAVASGPGLFITDSQIEISNCILIGNSAERFGGGILVTSDSECEITNCIFEDNSAGIDGGAIAVSRSSVVEVSFCTIVNNEAGTIADNGMGGGFYKGSDSNPMITNCIFWGNEADIGNQIYAQDNGGEITISYCDVEGGINEEDRWDGEEIIDEDPLLCEGREPDLWGIDGYFLDDESPCIDAGSELAEEFGFDHFTTRADLSPDEDEVDLGFHYDINHFIRFGILNGRVTCAETEEPIEGAIITTTWDQAARTDEEGNWIIEDAIAGRNFDITTSAEGWLDSTLSDLMLEEEEELEINFNLLYSEFDIDPEAINIDIAPDELNDIALEINNGGNGPLTWSVERVFPEDAQAEPWELRDITNVEEIVDDSHLNGVVFIDGYFYISGGNNGQNVNKIYVLNAEGELVCEFEQFHESRYGMRDLTWDGTLIWGTDEDVLYGFNIRGDLVETIEGEAESYRSLTWDPDEQVFWSADITSDIFATNINGEVVRTINRPGRLRIYSLAYLPEDPDGYSLYIFSRGLENPLAVYKVNLENGDVVFVTELDIEGGGRPGGINISNRLDIFSWRFISIVQNPDRVVVWHLASRTDWLTVEPTDGVINAGENEELTVNLNSSGYPGETDLSADLLFTHDGRGGSYELPVMLSVTSGGIARRTLFLNIGWNMVSLNVEPVIGEVPELFASLVEDGSLILIKDDGGHFFLPAYDFNNIRRWAGVKGYQIKMARRAMLTIEGEVIPWDTPIELRDRWNMISYLPRRPVDAMVALIGLGEALEIAKDGRGNFYIPAWDFSNMGDMCEGNGYYLKVDGDVGLVYNIEGDRMMVFDSHYDASDRAWLNELPCSGTSFSLLLLTDDLEAGTRIEAYTPSGILAGRGIVDADGVCGMALWGDDPLDYGEGRHSCRPYNSIGFSKGEEVTIVVYTEQGSMNRPLRVLGGSLRVIAGSPSSSSLAWTTNGWAVARLGTTSIPIEFGIHRAYPNPFNSQLRIEFALETKGSAILRAYNIAGREVAEVVSGEFSAGTHSSVWSADELPSGVYLVRLTAGKRKHVMKVVLVR